MVRGYRISLIVSGRVFDADGNRIGYIMAAGEDW
jgi:hypothetical protein